MRNYSITLVAFAVTSAIAVQSVGSNPQRNVAQESDTPTHSSAKKLGERLSVLGNVQSRRNTPDYWSGVSFEEFGQRLEQNRRDAQAKTRTRFRWISENGGIGNVDPFRAIEFYCENPPQQTLPTTLTLTVNAQQKDVPFGQTTVSILEIGIEVSDAFTLQNIGDRIRLYYCNLAPDDAITFKREYTCHWRNAGPWHRSHELSDSSARVTIYALLPFDADRDKTRFPKHEWTGRDIFVSVSSEHPGSLTSVPVFRLQRTAIGWKEIAYSSPEYCQFQSNLDFYLRWASGIGLPELVDRETGLTVRQFRDSEYGRDFDHFVRHYIEGRFSFPSGVEYDVPAYFVRPE